MFRWLCEQYPDLPWRKDVIAVAGTRHSKSWGLAVRGVGNQGGEELVAKLVRFLVMHHDQLNGERKIKR